MIEKSNISKIACMFHKKLNLRGDLLNLYARKYEETMKGDFLNEQEPLAFSPPKVLQT